MANAPKNRPPTTRSDRRSPRGHRPVPTNPDLRAQLAAAAARLRKVNSRSNAEAIEQLLAPRGWVALRDTDPARSAGPSYVVLLSKADRDHIVAAARGAHTAVTDLINEGFVKVLAGEYVPRKPPRARPGSTEEKVALNVSPSMSLRQQVEEATGMSSAHVAADYLMHRFEVGPYAKDSESVLAPGKVCNPLVPRPVRDLIRARAADAGRWVTDDVNEGFQKYLAGDFTPKAPAWADASDMTILKIMPNDELHAQVKATMGRRTLPQVAIAYLLDKYDIDPTTGQ